MNKHYTDEEVQDFVCGTVLATLSGIIHPAGAMGRIGTQFDRASAFRASYTTDGSAVASAQTEERILRAYVEVIRSLWNVHSQIQISLTQAPPSLGVLMERDVVWGALGVASEQGILASVELAKLYAAAEKDEPTKEDNSLSALFAAIGGGVPNKAHEAVGEILGDIKVFDESGAKVTYRPLRNNPWYVTVLGSLAKSLGTEIDLPSDAVLPERVSGWRP